MSGMGVLVDGGEGGDADLPAVHYWHVAVLPTQGFSDSRPDAVKLQAWQELLQSLFYPAANPALIQS